MKANTEYGLDGAFKVDFFDRKGSIVGSTDYFSNFITYSGLMYPLTFHFPECFRYLTIGNSSISSKIETTGIEGSPITLKVEHVYNGGSFIDQEMSYLGPAYYSKGNCGSRISKDGPAHFRAWRIPSGEDAVVKEDTTFREFMVSPSSGSSLSGRLAFSRVPREVTLKSGTSAIISYRLKLKTQSTGINYLTGFNISQADTEDGELVTLWATGTTGFYRQVYHGLSVVDINGNTFIPKFGDAMEPACKNINNLSAYFSADNSQFDCNPTGGQALSFASSYRADGLLNVAFDHDYSSVVADNGANPAAYKFLNNVISSHPSTDIKNYAKDIRYKTVKDPNYFKSTSDSIEKDYSQTFSDTDISTASPGKLGYNQDLTDYRNKATLSAVVIPLKFNLTTGMAVGQQQTRKKTITRRAIFPPVRSLGYNTRYGSFVYGFNQSASDNGPIWPVVDCLFSNNSGQLLMDHYRAITGIHIINPGSGISPASGKMVLSPESFGKFNYDLLVDSQGRLTGFVKDDNFTNGLYDLSLAAHIQSNLNEPLSTGKLYYPTSVTESNLVSIAYTDLHFSRGGFGTIKTGDYKFSETGQLIADFEFTAVRNSGFSGEYLSSILSGKKLAVANSVKATGFYVSNCKLNTIGSELNLNETALANCLTGFTLSYLSGSIYQGSEFFTGFSVITTPEIISINTGQEPYLGITALRITRFFDSQDFKSSLAARGSGISDSAGYFSGVHMPMTGSAPTGAGGNFIGFTPKETGFRVVFSGKDTLNNNLYITHLYNPIANNPGDWAGTSDITGFIRYTDFCAPVTTYVHKETGMLKPNNYYLAYSGGLISQIHGGTYPGLSDKNTLEVDINISWSAPCAGVDGCIGPDS